MSEEGLYQKICSYENLELAFEKARKGKTFRQYVIEFEKNLKQNLSQLRTELIFHIYRPKPLETFVIRDPKTRKISKSDFRDRIVHHALCNIIEPVFDKSFIYDSHANRIKKGTLKALQRFDKFKRKVSKNNTRTCYVLKADVKHYFETVNHEILLSIIKEKIKDKRLLWLIKTILANHNVKIKGKGMPLGNMTSQFFANVYLDELDRFVKHKLKANYYLRYVDDFIILHTSKETLQYYKKEIDNFLKTKLDLELHPDKSRILKLDNGVDFLGFKIFFYHKFIRKKNLKHFERKLKKLNSWYRKELIDRERAIEILEGWLAYVSHGNTYKYRKNLIRIFNQCFPIEQEIRLADVAMHERFVKETEANNIPFSSQKTLQLFKRGFNIKRIADNRNIKETTVWGHFAQLVEYNQLLIWEILPKERILKITRNIRNDTDELKEIKERIIDDSVTFDEVNCVLASIKCKNRKKNIYHHIRWYRKHHCYRKCYFNKKQRENCNMKFNIFISKKPSLEMKRKEFLELFNCMKICILPEREKRRYIAWNEFKLRLHKRR